MTLSCTIQGNAVSIMAGSFNASYTLNNRPTGSMRVYYTGSTAPGDEGDEVVVTRTSDSVVVFAGRITSVAISVDEVGNKFASYLLSGHEVLADRRIVAEVYINRTTGFIVGDLITKYLAADGITAGTIGTGIIIPRAVFGYQQLSNVLRILAEANGYIWYIDTAKALHFTERDLLNAPYDIDETVAGDRPIRGLRYERSLTQYRNRQYIQYNELTPERTERFAGDGETKTWSAEFAVASKPLVSVNNVAKTVGISGLDPDGSNDFYWSKGSYSIAQDFFAVPLSANGAVDVINDEVDVPFLKTIDASGTHAVATFHDASTGNKGVVLLRLTPTSIDKVYELPIVTDEVFIGVRAEWINDRYLLVQYYNATPNVYTQEVFELQGDVFVSTGADMNQSPISVYGSNGRNIVGIKSVFTQEDFILWTYNNRLNTITQTGTIAKDTNYSMPNVAVDGQYVVYAKRDIIPFGTTRIGLIKIDPQNDTWAATDEQDIQGTNLSAGQGVVVVGTYVFFLSNASPWNIKVYRINTTTDELEYVYEFTPPSGVASLTVTYINAFGSYIVLSGAFVGGDVVVLSFDFTSETLSLSGAYEDDINGVVSISQAGYGVYDRVAFGDDFVRAFRFSPDVLQVQYYGTFPNITQVDDFTEQTARVAAEGGTGIYEAFQSATDTDSEPSAIDIGQAILERYGRIPRVVAFDTQVEGYETGQIIEINWPSIGIIDEEYLIERMSIRDESASALWYQLRCISGRDIGNWQEFWRSLRSDGATYDFGGSDILPKAAAVQDMVVVDEQVTTDKLAAQTNWDEGNWDEMEWQ
jgi:hypothetical protein